MVGGDDGETSIFSGVEDAEPANPPAGDDQLDESAPVAPTGSPLDPAAMVRRFMRDLTIREVHAFVWGFAPWFLALVSGSALLITSAVVVTAAMMGVLKVRNPKTQSIVREPHYGLAGAVIGWLCGGVTLALVQIMAAYGGLVG